MTICATAHAWRYRKRVTDLSTGAVFLRVPILRVRLCSGATRSLMPADLWRGRCTITSLLETGVHLLADGINAAYDWAWQAGPGDEVVSHRTLGRWRDWIRQRVIGSALSWLVPATGAAWSSRRPEAPQLKTLLDKITGSVLVAFRARFGRALLDKTSPTPPPRVPDSSARPVPGRHAPTPSPDPPCPLRPRGSWSPSRARRSPPGDDPEDGEP